MTEHYFSRGFILLLFLCTIGLVGHFLVDATQPLASEHLSAMHSGVILSEAPALLYTVLLLLLGAAVSLAIRPWSPPAILRPPITG